MTDKPLSKSQSNLSSVSAAFIEHESFLKRFLKRFLSRPQDIEDVVQDTYLKARCAEKNQIINSPKAFLFRIARNEALKELRKKSRRITDYIEELDSQEVICGEASVEDQVIVKQKLGMFCESVLEMTPRCRRVFLMCKVYGLSYKEIASQLGISVSGVEKHVARGMVICNAYVDRMEQPAVRKQRETERIATNSRVRQIGATGTVVTPFSYEVSQKDSS
jgi:RNA polymerase sigma-70 factor (ECF subfamily)|tara:strand:+ start:1408 stop:2067 length:660 start_codon:yes stop_codon:yes gene_type:complete